MRDQLANGDPEQEGTTPRPKFDDALAAAEAVENGTATPDQERLARAFRARFRPMMRAARRQAIRILVQQARGHHERPHARPRERRSGCNQRSRGSRRTTATRAGPDDPDGDPEPVGPSPWACWQSAGATSPHTGRGVG